MWAPWMPLKFDQRRHSASERLFERPRWCGRVHVIDVTARVAHCSDPPCSSSAVFDPDQSRRVAGSGQDGHADAGVDATSQVLLHHILPLHSSYRPKFRRDRRRAAMMLAAAIAERDRHPRVMHDRPASVSPTRVSMPGNDARWLLISTHDET